jgi:hypothetical protein
MPGRTFSNSSELSLASNDSRPAHDSCDAVSSAPGTPLLSPLDGPKSKLAFIFIFHLFDTLILLFFALLFNLLSSEPSNLAHKTLHSLRVLPIFREPRRN